MRRLSPRVRVVWIFVFATVLRFSSLVKAQTADVYFGYSFVSSDLKVSSFTGNRQSRSIGRAMLHGWDASASLKLLPWVRVVADVGAGYGTVPVQFSSPIVGPTTRVDVDTHMYTYLFGPRFSVSVGHVKPFAHALLGVAHQNVAGNAFIGGGADQKDSAFALDLGGGIDVRLVKLIAWRVQGDYLQTQRLFGVNQHNPRVTTGIVLQF